MRQSEPIETYRNSAKGRTVEINLVKRQKQYRYEREQSEPADIYENPRRKGL